MLAGVEGSENVRRLDRVPAQLGVMPVCLRMILAWIHGCRDLFLDLPGEQGQRSPSVGEAMFRLSLSGWLGSTSYPAEPQHLASAIVGLMDEGMGSGSSSSLSGVILKDETAQV